MKIKFLFLFFSTLIYTKAQIPTAGLLGYYPFIGNASDLSGNAQNGTVSGASLTADRFGNSNCAYQFNGTSDYIALPASAYIGLNIYSYSLWYKASSSGNNGRIICIGENGGLCQSLTHQTSGNIFASSFNAGSTPSLSSLQATSVTLNQWTHVVITRDNSIFKMYVNGALTATAATNSTANYGSITPYWALIGARCGLSASYFFDGLIDDIRIYNVVLSAADATALYNELPCYQNISLTSTPGPVICSGSSATLATNGTSLQTVDWYNSATGTTSLHSGSLFPLPALTSTPGAGTYSYYVTGNGCALYPRSVIVLTVNPLPSLSVTAGSSVICNGESITLSASGASNYTWSPNAISFSIIPVVTVSPTITTTYTLTGADPNGCYNTLLYTQFVSSCTGIKANKENTGLNLIYPNPATNELHIPPSISKNSQVQIYSSEGRLVRSVDTDYHNTLNIEELPRGSYFIKVIENGKSRYQQKIIKQ